MNKSAWMLALGVLMNASASWAAEFPLEVRMLGMDEAFANPGEGASAQLKTGKPDAIAKEPKAEFGGSLYGVFESGEKPGLAFRLDESQGKGKGYDRLILDLNRNGDLTDDPAWKAVKREGREVSGLDESVFGPIEVPRGEKTGLSPARFYAEGVFFGSLAGALGLAGQLRLKPGCCLETTVDLDGVKQKIGFLDANCNMRFGDRTEMICRKIGDTEFWSSETAGDEVLRDRDGSGKFDSDLVESEVEPFAGVMYFGPNPYTTALSKDLKTVRFEPYSGPLGELTVRNGDKIYALGVAWESSPGKWEPLVLEVGSGKARVPAGNYRLIQSVLAAKDGKGIANMASVRNNTAAKSAPVKVEAGKSARLECGVPLNLEVSVEKRSAGLLAAIFTGAGKTLDISLTVAGAGGEVYNTFTKGRNEQADPPKFRIVDDTGKEVASANLEYG